MSDFLSFFVVLFAAVFFSALFNRLHLPWVVALLVGGIVIGPAGLGVFEPNATISFLGQIGLVFLMFMAGLETRLGEVRQHLAQVSVISLLNGILPFLAGMLVGLLFGYSLLASVLIGIIFISTSIAIVIPSLEARGIIGSRVGSTIVAATVFEDIVSLLLLSLVLQIVAPAARLPLWALYPLLVVFVLTMRWMAPRLRTLFMYGRVGHDLFQQELRFIFLLLIGVVILFEGLGLHTIIAGFMAGLVLSDLTHSRVLREKLRAVSYGLFIPIFFIVVGTQTNIRVLVEANGVWWLVVAVLVGSVGAKFISGWLGGLATGFSGMQSALVGLATTPSMTTTLAVAFTGLEFGLLDERIITALVLLSIVTTLIAPLGISLLAGRAAQMSRIKLAERPA